MVIGRNRLVPWRKRHGMERGRSLTLLTTDARNHFGVLQRRIRAGGEGKE